MKASRLRCNKEYWSKRYDQKCICVSIARYLVELRFLDKSKDGWYHCQEIEEVPTTTEKIIDITNLIG